MSRVSATQLCRPGPSGRGRVRRPERLSCGAVAECISLTGGWPTRYYDRISSLRELPPSPAGACLTVDVVHPAPAKGPGEGPAGMPPGTTRQWQRCFFHYWHAKSRGRPTQPVIDLVPGSPEWEALCRRCGECCFELVYDEDDTLIASNDDASTSIRTRGNAPYTKKDLRSATTASG